MEKSWERASQTDWLRLKPFAGIGVPENITGAEWQRKIKGRTGIVAFKNYWRRSGQSNATGGHIDLWYGSRLTSSSAQGAVTNFLRFVVGVNATPFYSDLGNSSEILFWDIK